jgi:hypothetical protein
MKSLFSALFLFCLLMGAAQAAEEYTFSLSEIEKKPYHIGGYLEFRPVLFGLDQNCDSDSRESHRDRIRQSHVTLP